MLIGANHKRQIVPLNDLHLNYLTDKPTPDLHTNLHTN